MLQLKNEQVWWPQSGAATTALHNTPLRRGSARDLEKDRAAGPWVLGGKGCADSQRALCPLPTAHYSLMVSPTTGSSSNALFWEQACHNVTPVWRKSVLERGYLWRAQWRAGPHTLFEQYLGFLVLSPAYKNKEKKKKIKVDRCCAVRQSQGKRS